MQYIEENKLWIDEVWKKLTIKLGKNAVSAGEKIPSTTVDGIYDDLTEKISAWTNGFWPGLMWLMYVGTEDEKFKKVAECTEKKLDKALWNFKGLYHDVGFMWHISAGVNYKITGNEDSKNRNLHAAASLASRYNIGGDFIRSWNWDDYGWVIIDSMMNLPLLYWASEEIGDPRFKKIAMHHADKVLENHIRPDGSVYHVVKFDSDTGEVLGYPHTQGYEPNSSSWTRGQAWAIYGFVLSYIHTGEKRYLDAAKRVAHYFIAAVAACDYVPTCDFRSPKEPYYYDTSAGSTAACGLIEIAKIVDEYEKDMYISAAIKILKAIEEKHCDWSDEEQGIVKNAMAYYKQGVHKNTIYGDYYFTEAIYKLKGFDMLFW